MTSFVRHADALRELADDVADKVWPPALVALKMRNLADEIDSKNAAPKFALRRASRPPQRGDARPLLTLAVATT